MEVSDAHVASSCKQCLKPIAAGELRIRRPKVGNKSASEIHVACYGVSGQLRVEHFTNVFWLSPESQAKLNNFIREYNEKVAEVAAVNKRKREDISDHAENERAVKKIKVTALESDTVWDVDEDSLITALPTEIILPILKQLGVIDICRITRSCKKMLVLCEDDAVWQERATNDWILFTKTMDMSWKKFYIYAYQNSCVECKKPTEQKHFFWPLVKRLCFDCRSNPKYQLITGFGILTAEDIKNSGIRAQKIYTGGSTYNRYRGRNYQRKYSSMYLSSQLQELNELKKNGELTGLKLLEIKKKNDEQLERARINYKFRNAGTGSDIKDDSNDEYKAE